jgi:hypothetical protein
MTRDQALTTAQRLGADLAPDQAGVSRLLERIAQRDDAEMVRAALIERGAAAVLAVPVPMVAGGRAS